MQVIIMLSKLSNYSVVVLSGLVVLAAFDWFLSNMLGFEVWSDIHVLLSTEFMSASHLFHGLITLIILLISIHSLTMNDLSARIRLGVIFGLIMILIGLVNIAMHLKTIPNEFLANQLAPISAVLLIKMTLLTWVMAQVHRSFINK